MIGKEEEREKREEGISEPLVHPVTKDREGAGNPEITKVKKGSPCTEGYIYTLQKSPDFKVNQAHNGSMTKGMAQYHATSR